jgi:hypothetical protein
MSPFRLALVCCLLGGAASLPAQALRDEEKGTFLGALFAPAPAGHKIGVLVTHVLPDSPAARAGVRRHDVLLRYDETPIRDCRHFVALIQGDRPGRKVSLTLSRDGREEKVEATLAEGPALRNAQAPRALPSVSVAATPLEDGKMKVTIVYQSEGRKPQKVVCQGASADIDGEVNKLPPRERGLVRAALERIRRVSTKQ